MTAFSPQRKHITIFVFLLVIIATLVGALWQYHQMVVAIYDGASASVYRRMLRPFSAPRDTLGQKPVRIALLYSATAAAILGAEEENAEDSVRQWEHFLSSHNFSYRRISDLPSDDALADFNVLIMPMALTMSDADIETVKRFTRRGNGVIMTWASGSRDAQGRWQSSRVLQQVAGIDLGPAIPDGNPLGRIAVALDATSPLNLGVDPGFTLSLTRFDQPLAAVVREPRTQVAGAWVSSQSPTAGLVGRDGLDRERAVMVHGDYFGGRFVWLGFTIASGAPAPEQRKAFEQILRNSIAWSARQPLAYKSHWPGGVASGFSLSWRITQASHYNESLPAMAADYGVPLTSFVPMDLLDESPALARTLAAAGEVGLLAPVSWDDEDAVPTVAALMNWRRRLSDLNGGGPVGCLLTASSLSDAWKKALVEARFDYVASGDYNHLLPSVLRTYRSVPILTRAHELWLLPTTVYEGGLARVGDQPGLYASELQELAAAINARSGLFHLNLNAAHIDGVYLNRLNRLLAEVKRSRVWAVGCGEVLDFYSLWGHIRISSDYPTPNRFLIQVSNTGTRSVEDVEVFILLDSRRRLMEVSPTTLGTPPAYPVSEDGIIWRFDIPRIPAGKNYVYHSYRSL